MKIAIMGAGGIGSCYGGLLARAGCDVTLIARGAHLHALQQNGLQLNRQDGSFTVQVPATDDPSQVGLVDLVLFTVKTYHNNEAIPFMKPLVGDGTSVLSLQNGVESADQLAQEHGAQRVLPGAAYVLGNIYSPGVVRQGSPQARIAFGESSGEQTHRALAIQETLTSAGITVDLTGDVEKVLWSKLLYNSPANGLASAARLSPRDLMEFPNLADLFKTAIQEVYDVAKANGVDLVDEDVQASLDLIANRPFGARGSMQADLEAGRPLELEAIVGVVGRIGRKVNVSTPVFDLLYALLLPYKDGPPKDL